MSQHKSYPANTKPSKIKEDIWQKVHQLSRLYLKDPNKHLDDIRKFIKNPQFSDFQKEKGIYIAGFLYADQSKLRVHPMFFEPALELGGNDQHSYMLPYLWEDLAEDKKKIAERLVDRMFLLMRDMQDPWGQDDLKIPEYFKHLPFGELSYLSKVENPETPGLTVTNPNESHIKSGIHPDKLYQYAVDIEMWIRDYFGIHYCMQGETLFYTYAWRLLVNKIMRSRSDYFDIAPFNEEVSLWKSNRWLEIDPEGITYEGRLALWMREGLKLLNPERFDSTYSTSAREIEEDFSVLPKYNYIQFEDKPWLKDCFYLGLLNYKKPRRSKNYTVLLKFMKTFFPTHRKKIDEIDNKPTLIEKISELDDILREIVDELLGPGEIIEKLKRLHDNSRFPIIPYFYWNALEPRYPKTHLVCPIWNSFSTPLTVFRKQYNYENMRPCRPFGFQPGICEEIESPLTAVAVTGVRPLKIDWTKARKEYDSLSFMKHSGDLRRIKNLLEKVAQPQIDSWFVGQIKRMEYMNEGDKRRTSSFGHEISRLVETIKKLYDPAKNVNSVTIYNPDLFEGALQYIDFWASNSKEKIGSQSLIDDADNIDYLGLFKKGFNISYAKKFGLIMKSNQARNQEDIKKLERKIFFKIILPKQRWMCPEELKTSLIRALIAGAHNTLIHSITKPKYNGPYVDIDSIEDIPIFIYEKNPDKNRCCIEIFNFFEMTNPNNEFFGRKTRYVMESQFLDIPKLSVKVGIEPFQIDMLPPEIIEMIQGKECDVVNILGNKLIRKFNEIDKKMVALTSLQIEIKSIKR
ncbi:MAG: hypothetical protein PVH61_00020 [Candidatus Aminicenantes bacterium]